MIPQLSYSSDEDESSSDVDIEDDTSDEDVEYSAPAAPMRNYGGRRQIRTVFRKLVGAFYSEDRREPDVGDVLVTSEPAAASTPANIDQQVGGASAEPDRSVDETCRGEHYGTDEANTGSRLAEFESIPLAAAGSKGPAASLYRNRAGASSLYSVMPILELGYGESAIKGCTSIQSTPTLNDTGSFFSLMSLKFAREIGAKRVATAQKPPTLLLANNAKTTALGMVVTSLHIGPYVIQEYFWVMETSCYDAILGSSFFFDRKCIIDYNELCISYAVGPNGERVKLRFNANWGETQVSAVALYAAEPVVVRPGVHCYVPVRVSKTAQTKAGAWGLAMPSGKDRDGFLTARGVITVSKSQMWVQVSNLTDSSILIAPGRHVADFHEQDRSAYEVYDWDLDVEEKLARHSRDAQSVPAAASVSTHQCEGADVAGGNDEVDALRREVDEQMKEVESLFSKEPLDAITLGTSLAKEEIKKLQHLVSRFAHLWDKPDFTDNGAAPPHDVTCNIELTEPPSRLPKPRIRSVNPSVRQQITEEVRKQREQGVIEQSCSPYASTVLLVPKADGTVRFCVDYRPLNKITRKDGYMMPRVDDSLASLEGSQFFSSLDLTAAFNQIPMDEESKDLTSFVTADGTWRYNRMPFGLVNGPAVFSRFIDTVLAGLKWTVCLVYMDDVLVHTATFEEHLDALQSVFERIDAFGLRFKAKKCFIAADEVKFLGHIVGKDGVKADPGKTKAIREMPVPDSKEALRSALGLFGYYRRFVKGYSRIAHPLTEATHKDFVLPRSSNGSANWSEKQLKAFEQLREALVSAPILRHPDWSRPFEIHTDACHHGLGAVLCQRDESGKEYVVCFASRSLTKLEAKYNTYELECLAVKWAASLWYGMYLYGRRFKVYTDNQAIKWLFDRADSCTGRLQKWIISLQDLDYEVVHRKGTCNGNADGLSRCCLPSTCPYNEEPDEPLYGAPPPIACPAMPDAVCSHADEVDCDASKNVDEDSEGQHMGAVDDLSDSGQQAETETDPGGAQPTHEPGGAYFPPRDLSAWTRAEWSELQKNDDHCKRIIDSIQSSGQGDAKAHFRIEDDGVLVRVTPTPPHLQTDTDEAIDVGPLLRVLRGDKSGRNAFNDSNTQLVVPQSLKAFVLWRHHGLPLSGHQGRKRTYSNVRRRFYWKGMYTDVRRWVRSCSRCWRRKLPRPTRVGEPRWVLSQHPMHTVCIDLQGPLPVTAEGNRWVLTMLDTFTRWPIAIPIPDSTSSTIASALFRHLLCVHGCPVRILSDKGRNLISKGVSYMCKKWQIARPTTTGYQPQSVPVERFHRTLNSAMTMLHCHFGLDWDGYVDAALFMYRVSECDSSGFSPYQLMYGRQPMLPDDVMLSVHSVNDISEEEYYTRLSGRLAKAYSMVFRRQLAAAEKNAMMRQERMRIVTYVDGQSVFFWQPSHSQRLHAFDDEKGDMLQPTYDISGHANQAEGTVPSKWKFRWTGPHKVVSKSKHPNVYLIRLRTDMKVVEANVNRLAPFYPWSKTLPTTVRGVDITTFDDCTVGGKVPDGSLFVFPLGGDIPFGVGQLLGRNDDGSFRFWWFSNYRDNVSGPFHPGWHDKRSGRYVWQKSIPVKGRKYYEAFTNDKDHCPLDVDVTDASVVVYGFERLKSGHLPENVVTVISQNTNVDWSRPPI